MISIIAEKYCTAMCYFELKQISPISYDLNTSGKFVNVSRDSSKVEAGSGETGSRWFSDGSQRRGLEGGLFALPGP